MSRWKPEMGSRSSRAAAGGRRDDRSRGHHLDGSFAYTRSAAVRYRPCTNFPYGSVRNSPSTKPEVDDEQQRHGGLAAQRQQEQAGGARHEQHEDERLVEPVLRRIARAPDRGCRRSANSPSRADQQSDAAERAEHDRETTVAVRRAPAENDVIEGRDARGREAQREAVHRQMVKAAAPRRPLFLRRPCSPRRRRADVEA